MKPIENADPAGSEEKSNYWGYTNLLSFMQYLFAGGRMITYTGELTKASIFDRMKARLPTYWRYLREEPKWIVMFVFARTLAARRFERWLSRAPYRQPISVPDSVLGALDANKAVAELIKTGVYTGLSLPPEIVRQMVDFAETNPCFARDNQTSGFLPKDVAEVNSRRDRDVVAGYYFEAVSKSPPICQLGRDPALLNIARSYIGHEPVLIRTRLWWSFPAVRVSDADLHAVAQEKFHFDMNGWRTLKFFFYLTPSNEDSGAHRCIPGSHRHRALRQQLTLTVGRSMEELKQYYGEGCFLTITGDAGAGFAEDPFLFHTGSLCKTQPRLILEIEYGPAAVSPSYRYGRLG